MADEDHSLQIGTTLESITRFRNIYSGMIPRFSVISWLRPVDHALGGGGFRRGFTYAVAGLPGCGKTTLLLQACVDATLPTLVGGSGGRAVFIDCDGSFAQQRLDEIVQAAESHVATVTARSGNQVTVNLASHVNLHRVYSISQLVQVLSGLPPVACVCIDGLTRLLREERVLPNLGQLLREATSEAARNRVFAELMSHLDNGVGVNLEQLTKALQTVSDRGSTILLSSDFTTAFNTAPHLKLALPESVLELVANTLVLTPPAVLAQTNDQNIVLDENVGKCSVLEDNEKISDCFYLIRGAGIREARFEGKI